MGVALGVEVLHGGETPMISVDYNVNEKYVLFLCVKTLRYQSQFVSTVQSILF